jgi:hypothetical protein
MEESAALALSPMWVLFDFAGSCGRFASPPGLCEYMLVNMRINHGLVGLQYNTIQFLSSFSSCSFCNACWSRRYLWHFRSRRKVSAALFSAGFAVAPRTTLVVCYLVGEPFPFQLLENYDLGIGGQLLMWLLPQMHVLHLVLRFAAQLPVVVVVQVS